jgi:uncharacterized repeat protein (TIGR03803 family)
MTPLIKTFSKRGFILMRLLSAAVLALSAVDARAAVVLTGRIVSGELVRGNDGYLYGTTSGGGTNGGGGTVFKISPSGAFTSLYSFHGANDGDNPRAGLVQASDGNFYGTTWGGTNSAEFGYGTVFKISPDGALTSL